MTAHLAFPLPVRRLRPLLLPAAMLAFGVVLGGVAGFMVVFAAVALAFDRALDFGGTRLAGADDAFRRLRRRRPSGALAYLADDTGWAATCPRRRLGVQPIAVNSVVGTSDRHKAEAFDREFRPPGWSRVRWSQMYHAEQRGAELPPISVYRVGEEHFVRDGHHRVSVARALGMHSIEADVVELIR